MKPKSSDKNKSGIYCIRNTENNKVYIGKAKCIWKRIHGHLSAFRKEDLTKTNEYLLNSIKKYGINKFEYFVLEYLDFDENILAERELFWIKTYSSIDRTKGYNFRMDSSTGMICHKETSLKISKRLINEWKQGFRKNHKEKLSNYWKDNNERKVSQSQIMTKNLTKYFYNIYDIDEKFIKTISYKELKEENLQNVIASFHKSKKDKIKFKNFIIEKITIKDIV